MSDKIPNKKQNKTNNKYYETDHSYFANLPVHHETLMLDEDIVKNIENVEEDFYNNDIL